MFDKDEELALITKQMKIEGSFRVHNIAWPGCVLLSLNGKLSKAVYEQIICGVAYIKVVRPFIDKKTKRTFYIWGFQNSNGEYINVLAVLSTKQSIELERAFYNYFSNPTISFPPYTQEDERILKRIFKPGKCVLMTDNPDVWSDFANILAKPFVYWIQQQ